MRPREERKTGCPGFFVQRIRASGIRHVNKIYFLLHSTYMHCSHAHVHGQVWIWFFDVFLLFILR